MPALVLAHPLAFALFAWTLVNVASGLWSKFAPDAEKSHPEFAHALGMLRKAGCDPVGLFDRASAFLEALAIRTGASKATIGVMTAVLAAAFGGTMAVDPFAPLPDPGAATVDAGADCDAACAAPDAGDEQ